MSHAHAAEPDALPMSLFPAPVRVTGNRDRVSQQIQTKLGDYHLAQTLLDDPSKSIGICAEPPSPAPCPPSHSRRDTEFKKPSHAPQNGRVHHRSYPSYKSELPGSTGSNAHRPPPLRIPNGFSSQSTIDSSQPPIETILKEMRSLPTPLSVIAATPRKEAENKFIFNPYTNKVQENPQLVNNDLKAPPPKPGLDSRITNSRNSVSPEPAPKEFPLSESDDEAPGSTTRLEPILSPIGSGGSPSSGSESSQSANSDSESESSSAESGGPAATAAGPGGAAPVPAPAPPPAQRPSWSLSSFIQPSAATQPPQPSYDSSKELRHALAEVQSKTSPLSELSDSDASSPTPSPNATRRRRSVAKRASAASSDDDGPRHVNTSSPRVPASSAGSSSGSGAKRGRPSKPRTSEENPAKKKRGRPRKLRPTSPPAPPSTATGPVPPIAVSHDSDAEPDPPQHHCVQDTKTHIFRKVFTPRKGDEGGGKGAKGGKGKGGKGKGQVKIIEVNAPESGADDDERRSSDRERSNERRNEEAIARVSPPREPDSLARRREAERLASERLQERVLNERSDHRDRLPERTSNDRGSDRLSTSDRSSTSDRLSTDRIIGGLLSDRMIANDRASERGSSDRLQERASADRLSERAANDRLSERAVSDRLSERAASDRLSERAASDRLSERAASDRLSERVTNDRLMERAVNDRLTIDRANERRSTDRINDRLSSDRIASDKLSSDRNLNDRIPVDRITTDRITSDRILNDRLLDRAAANDRATSDRIPSDRSDRYAHDRRTTIDKPSLDRLSSDRGFDRVINDRLSGDKTLHERLPGDKIFERAPERTSLDRFSDKMTVDRVNEKVPLDRLPGDKISLERITNDKSLKQRMSSDKTSFDRIPVDKISTERLPSDKLLVPNNKLSMERVEHLERLSAQRYVRAEADVGSGLKSGRGSERLEEASSNVVSERRVGRARLLVRLPLSRLRPDTVAALRRPQPRRTPVKRPASPVHHQGCELPPPHLEPANGQTPIYYSYFERLPADALSDEEKNHQYYLDEAQRLRAAAEREQEPLPRVMLYLESVLCFVLTGRVLELELDTKQAFTIYRETIEYIKSIHSMPQRFRASPHSTFSKLDILSLRVQALLYLRMFKMYNREVKEYYKIVQEYQQKPASAQSVSPLSPSPSPAGSVGSVGSGASSGYCSLVHSVPAGAHHALLQLTKYYTFLYVAHDLWEQADSLCRLRANQDLFIAVDRKCGPLTLFSTFRHLVQYVRFAISLLKNTPRD